MRWSRFLAVGCLAIVALCAVRVTVRAEEPADRFLDALKSNNYAEAAAKYLRSLHANSDQKPGNLNGNGDLLTRVGLSERDPIKRDAILAEAQVKLQEFLKTAGNRRSSPDALILLGCLTQTRGITLRKLAEKAPSDQRGAAYKAAREQLLEARKLLDDSDKRIATILTPIADKLKKQEDLSKEEADLKDEFFPILPVIRVKAGDALTNYALTFDPKSQSKEYQAALTEANREFDEAFRKYSPEGYDAAYFARINQAHNILLLGKAGEAAKIAWQICEDDVATINAAIFKKALRVAIEASLVEGKYAENWPKIESAMNENVPRVSNVLDAEITYFAALFAEKTLLSLGKPNEKEQARAAAQTYLKKLLRFKSQFDYAAPTRELAKRMNVKSGEKGKGDYEELLLESKLTFRGYAEAYQKWYDFQGSDDERKMLEQERDALHESTFDVIGETLAVAPRDARPEDLTFLRYVVGNYYSQRKNYYAAIVFSEAAAHKSTDETAGKAAGIVIKSLQEIRSELSRLKSAEKKPTAEQSAAIDRESSSLGRRIRTAAQYLLRNWPAGAEADGARLILVTTELENSRFAEAGKVVTAMKAGSPLRSTAEVILGSVAAQKYYAGKFGKDADEASIKAAEALKPYAIDGLKTALLAGVEKKLDERSVMGAYLLFLIQLREGTIDPRSLKIIDQPKTGLFALIAAGDETIPEKSSFDISRIVFQTYLQSGNLPAVLKMLDVLEKQAGADRARKKLVDVIIMSACNELKVRIKELREKGDAKKAGELVAAQSALLNKLSERTDRLDFPTLYAISEAYTGLADGDPDRGPDFAKKAEGIYEVITARAAKQPDFVAPGVLQLIRVKQIGLMRGRGDFEAAYAQLKAIIREKKGVNIPAEKEAAITLQQWGDAEPPGSKNRYDRYTKACMGEVEGDKQIVFGWNKIWQTMYRQPTFNYQGEDAEKIRQRDGAREQFFDARYRLAGVRLKMAQEKAETDPLRAKLLDSVKQAIKQSYDVKQIAGSPVMGGAERRAEYEKLLKQAQTLLKEQPVGFQEFIIQDRKQDAETAKSVAGG